MDSECKDVSAIQDEDVLRRMWQHTEDFGKKKEIRAHMYKLREARLKEFYTSGEVLKDVQRSNSSPGLREQHVEKNQKWIEGGVTHADSLADHSFLSLKSKEIRDSESPTRDVQFRNSKNRSDIDGNWTVASKTTKSSDGKTIINSQLATTQGSRPVDGGNLSYAAINQQEASVYTDGDANNFTKAVGESSKTFAQEQVVTGDENNFKTSKTVSSSSSSKFVSHSASTTGNIKMDDSLVRGQLQIEDGRSGTTRIIHNQDTSSKTGKHQQETRTSVEESCQNQQQSQNIQGSKSSSTVTKRIQSVDTSSPNTGTQTTVVTKVVHGSDLPEDLKKSLIDGNTKVITETKTLPDGSTVTTTRYETKGSKKWSSTSGSTQVTSSNQRQVVEQKSSSTHVDTKQHDYVTGGNQNKTVITTATKQIENFPDNAENIRIVKSENQDGGQIHITKHQENVYQSKVSRDDSQNITKQNMKNIKITQDNDNNQTVKVTKTITTSEDHLQPVVKQIPQNESHTSVQTTKTSTTIKSNVDQAHVDKAQQVQHNIDIVVSKQEGPKEPKQPLEKPKSPVKEIPKKMEPAAVRPQEIELTKTCKPPAEQYKPSEPTEGQYSTTYRSEFTPKRISVDISPTHDAFVRSLRCKSPDRLSDRPNSRGQSTASLRSSTSPEKTSYPSRKSPERKTSHPSRKSPESKPSYDRRSPDKYFNEPAKKHNTSPSRPKDYSPENRYAKNDSSPDRVSKSPDRSYQRTSPSTTTKVTSYTTDITSRKKSNTNVTTRKSPERPITSSPTRSISPTKSGPSSPTRNTDVIITTRTTKVTKTSSPEKTSPIRSTSPNKNERSPSKSKDTTENATFNSDTITRKKKPEDGNKISKPIDLSNTTKTDTITRRTNKQTESVVIETDKSVVSENINITDIKKSKRPSSRDASPTTSVSDFEFVMHTNQQMVTDLDEPEVKYPEKRPTSLDIDVTSTTTTIRRTEQNSTVSPKQPGSPVKESPRQKSPTKSSPVKSPTKASSPTKPISSPFKEVPKRTEYQPSAPELEPDEQPPTVFTIEDKITITQIEPSCERPKSKEPKEKPPLKRTETYEERCRKMLGLPEPEKPSTKEEIVPNEYEGRTPIEEPLFVKKHIDYGHPEDDIIKKTTDKIKSRKAEKKEPVDISEFITIEKNIENDILPVEDTLPKVVEPKLFSSPTRKSPEKQKSSDKKPVGQYGTEYTDEYTDKPRREPTPKHENPEFSPEIKTSPKNIEDLPGYMRPIPKISPEERDKMILENRQRDTSPDKQPKTTPEYPDEHIEQFEVTHSITAATDKTIEKKLTRKSPERSPIHKQPQKKRPDDKYPEDRTFTTEYTDEYCEEREIPNKNAPTRKSSDVTDITKHVSNTKITSRTYKQVETPVQVKSPTKKPDKKTPKNKKPNDSDSSSSDDESIEVDEYYRTEVKTDIKTKDKKINRKSPSPVRRKPDLDRKSPEKDRESPSRGLPENVTVTEYINEYCETSKESELFDTPRKTTTTETDFISKEKLDTDINLEKTTKKVTNKPFEKTSSKKQLENIEFDLKNENIQLAHIRTHRIDSTKVNNETQPRETSPKRQPQKAIPSDTIECKINITTSKKDEEEKKSRKSFPEERSKSPTKNIKDVKKDNNKTIVKKTSSDFIETTKRRTTNETLKKKSSVDKSPERRSPSPTIKTNIKKTEETTRFVESVTRKCSKKDIPIKNIPDSKPIKPITSKAPESPARKSLYQTPVTSPDKKPTKQIPKQSQPTETSKKHVVTKTISLSSRTDTKSQPSSPVKETKPATLNKTSPKTFTSIKTTKVTHPATITVTKLTKTTAKTTKQNSKKVESSDSESELGVEDLRAEINNKTSRVDKKHVITTAKINVTSPKHPSSPQVKSKQHPNVTMPIIKVNTDEIITDNHLHKPITILIDTNNQHEPITITVDNQATSCDTMNQPNDRVTSDKPSNIKKLTTKCLSTKSIVLNNSTDDITVDLQRSTSSREPSPDKICPVPVSSDDEYGYPRYPDQVSEPDDKPSKKRSQKITDIPLTEGEDVKNFNRITEITETVTTKRTSPRITDIDKVMDTDESLLSVTEKVSKFITTAEKLTEDEPKTKKPAPKVPRPELIVTEDLKEDECLLSVSDKVSKFINTAEQVSTKKNNKPQAPHRPTTNDFKVEENDECLRSVNEKVNRFIHAAETSKQVRTSPRVERTEITDLDDNLRTDECLLSVSDKVSKFLTTADKLTTETSKTKTEIFINKEREQSPEKTEFKRGKSPEKKPETPPLIHTPSRKSPERKSPEKHIKICSEPRKETEPVLESNVRPKSEPSQTLKSSEAVKKAKAMFENISKTQEIPKQRDILSRPSIWEGRKKPDQKPVDDSDIKLTDIGVYKKSGTSDVRKQLNYNQKDDVTLKSTKLILNERKFDTRSKSKSPERDTSTCFKPKASTVREEITTEKNGYHRTKSPERDDDIPGYMRPIPKVTTEERDQLIIETRIRESITPERNSYRRTEEHEEHVTEVFRTKPIENGDVPGYMRPLQRCLSPERDHKKTVREEEEIVVETALSRSYSPPEKDIPGYMKPLQRNVSPDRDTTDNPREYSPVPDDAPRSAKKFGVTLRRTDSGRVIPAERRRSSIPGQPVIEEIQDLEVLERMMDKVVGYEQRRRIRAQIRVVKRLISENKISLVKRPTKPVSSPARDIYGSKSAPLDGRRSPAKKLPTDKSKQIHEIEYKSSITRERSKSPQTKKRPSLESQKITTDRKSSDLVRDRSISPETKRRTCLSQAEKEFKTESTFKSSSYTSSSQSQRNFESRTSKERSMSPDIKNTTTAAKVYKTDLKHVQPTKMSPIQPDKPSWITNRNLKKTTDSVSERRNITTISKKKETPKRAYSPQKETKPTDCITSSYGIGPTDENGLPLFGIKALRKAADKVQVRGTVVTSEYYSENGNEPVGEVTVTKYSTDPKDLDIHDTKKKGFTSVTTTQKFGSRGAPSLRTLTDKKKAITDKNTEQDEIIKTTSTKVTRRGSVKALSQKFIENAVETTTKEKQACYPKAGLILRTSSFKDSSQPTVERTRVVKSSSRESSPGYESRPTKISLESITSDSRNFSSSTSTEQTKTFLNSHTRVTSAQDVISRMKNAEKEQVEGDTEEDREARMLLNKFLGAQVLMSGMEPLLGTGSSTQSAVSSSAQLVRKVQKTKSTSSTSNKDSSKASVKQRFQCPITPEVLEDIWDEQTLRALLEQCTDYEERRAIRARLRQVMAEQEAVANVISSAVAERDSSDNRHSVHGESLLLPLLQELLDKKCAHQQSQQQQQQQQQQQNLMNRSASSQSSEESQTATVDSGTESGEDLRFLAVGLCDSMVDASRSAGAAGGIEPLGPGLLAEVQHALSRLAMSLQVDSTDVDLEPGRKHSLLQLVARLQSSLVVPAKPPTERRSSTGRFARHKNRQNRHTVGVSSEEIAAARKLMQEVVLRDNMSSGATPDYVTTPPEYTTKEKSEGYCLQKQNSDGCVTGVNNGASYRPMPFATPVKNATAKPFSPPGFSFSADQPTFSLKSVSEPVTPNDFTREKVNLRQTSLNLEPTEPYYPEIPEPSYYDATDLKIPNYQPSKTPEYNIREYHESETDDDSSTVKHSEEYESARQSLGSSPTHLHYVTDVKTINRITPVNETLDFRNDSYMVDKPQEENLSAAQRLLNLAINDDTKTASRFNNKKLKMKRANTIDIPKPLNYYENDDESDDSILDRDDTTSSRRSNYLALRGPIRVGNSNKSTVPTFEPKTENDKKFMAFIQKHNSNNQNVSSIWLNKTNEPVKRASAEHNWSRKFGNIKTIFEKDENNSRPSSTTVSSAKQFWQSADDAVNAGKRSYVGPKVNKQGTRQLQSLFEQKQQESKLPWTSTEHNNVVTGTLKVESNFKPIQNNQLIQGKNYKFIPQPLPVNKFSHAPMSAFKPPQKRSTPVQQASQSFNYPTSTNSTNVVKQQMFKNEGGHVSEPTTPLFLYTPKQPEFPAAHPEEPKPTGSAPWVNPAQQGEHRVLSIAASRFENPSREMSPQPPVRKVIKDKVHIPPILKQNNSIDHSYNPQKQYSDSNNLSSPYLVKNLQPNKSVRKLSGEYDNIAYSNKQPENIVTYKQPVPVTKPTIERNNNYTPVQVQQPQKPVQTVQKNVQKFSSTTPTNTTYNYPKSEIKPKPNHVNSYQNHEDVSYMNSKNDSHRQLAQITPKPAPVAQKPARRASGEYDFTSQNISYKSQIPYQIENEVSQISQKSLKPLVFDFPDSESSSAATPDNLDEPTVTSPLTEYKAVSKVMTGPVSQQAVTVTQNTPKTRDDHDMARSLQKVLKNISLGEDLEEKKNAKPSLSPKPSYKSQNEQTTAAPSKNYQNTSSYAPKPQYTEDRRESLKKAETYAPSYKYSEQENSKHIEKPVQYDGRYSNQKQQIHTKEVPPKTQLMSKSPNPMYDCYSSQPQVTRPTNKIPANAKPFSTESSLEINDDGESVVTTKLQIPVNRNVYYNNTDPNKVQQRLTIDQVEANNRRLSPQPLIKSDSWHKLAEPPQPASKPSPRASPKARNILQKAKSSHSLAVPKQFEAGLSRDEVEVKKKTVAAYFGGPSPVTVNKFSNAKEENLRTSINRKTTAQKITTQSKGTSLSRSRTMPEVADLFEENLDVDEEFENIFRASIAK